MFDHSNNNSNATKFHLTVKFYFTRNCFVTLPNSIITRLLTKQPGTDAHAHLLNNFDEFNYYSTRKCLKLTWTDTDTNERKKAYVGWEWGTNNLQPDTIEIPNSLAINLGIKEDQSITVEEAKDIPDAESVFVEPDTADDSEILERNQRDIEDHLLNQVMVVYPGLVFPLWIRNVMINMRVERMEPENSECAFLARGSELIVRTKSRPAQEADGSEPKKSKKTHKMKLTAITNQLLTEYLRSRDNVPGSALDFARDNSYFIFASKQFMSKCNFCDGDLIKITSVYVKREKITQDPTAKPPQPDQPLEEYSEKKLKKFAFGRLLCLESPLLKPNQIAVSTKIQMQLCSITHATVDVVYTPEIASSLPRAMYFKRAIHEHDEVDEDEQISSEDLKQAIIDWVSNQNAISAEPASIPISQKTLLSLPIPTLGKAVDFAVSVNESLSPFQSSMFSDYGGGGASNEEDSTFSFIDPKSVSEAQMSNFYLLSPQSLANVHISYPQGPEANVTFKHDIVDPYYTFPTAAEFGVFKNLIANATDKINAHFKDSPLKSRLMHPTISHKNGGGRIAHILISGSDGTGKTTFARTLCKEADTYCVEVKCVEMAGDRVDTAVMKLRSYVEEAKAHAPSTILFDDIDAICPLEQEEVMPDPNVRVLASIFIDVISRIRLPNPKSNICTIVTCKTMDNVHKIIQRSGLFETRIHLPMLTRTERIDLFTQVLRKNWGTKYYDISDDTLRYVSLRTENYSASDIKSIVDRTVNMCMLRNIKERDQSAKSGKFELKPVDFDAALEGFTSLSKEGINLMKSDIRWEDVGGLIEVKKIIKETLEFPTKYGRLFENAPLKLRSGLMLYGPPGCGKTLIASAVARECGLNFISVKGPELLNKYIGASEQSVRDVFMKAEAAKPCVVFFDEFDAIAPKRGHDSTGVTDRVVNQFLVQLDGVESRAGVYVLAATSRPDLIDAALLRPGRLDKHLLCPMPNQEEREQILRAVSRKLVVDEELENSWGRVAEWCEHYSGADLQALLYSAQIIAAHEVLGDAPGKDATASNTNTVDSQDEDEEMVSSGSSSSANKGKGKGKGKAVVNKNSSSLPAPASTSSHYSSERTHVVSMPLSSGTKGSMTMILHKAAPNDRMMVDKESMVQMVENVQENMKALKLRGISDDKEELVANDRPKVVITLEHVREAFKTSKPSISDQDRRAFEQIYADFVASRGGAVDSAAELAEDGITEAEGFEGYDNDEEAEMALRAALAAAAASMKRKQKQPKMRVTLA